MLLSDYEAVV